MARQRWASRTIFLLAAVGSAVGLGNIWRFPYLAGRYGGGAFLVPYLIALLTVGIPLLMLEFVIGQRMQRGAISSFRKLHPGFGSLGIYALVSSFIIVSYYAVVMAWCLYYFVVSLRVPWADDATAYFFNTVLQLSDSVSTVGGIQMPILLGLVGVWVSIFFCVWQGTKSVGKVVLYSVPLPIVLLGLLLLRAVTLPGFLQGWKLYLWPNWSALADPAVWTSAFSQIFFTLSLGFGIMVAYASYKDSEADIAKDTWLTALINSAISLFAGFVVFGVLGYMSQEAGIPLAELAAQSGPGLAFVVFPEALSLMPLAPVFSLFFFLMLFSLGIDSAFSLVEAINAAFADWSNRWRLDRIALVVCIVGFLTGILYTTRAGLYFLDIADHFVTNYNLLLVGLFQAILGGWVYGAEQLRRYVDEVSDWRLGKWWNVSIKYVVPFVLVLLLGSQLSTDLKTPYGDYPGWALGLGWAIAIAPLLLFAILAAIETGNARPSDR